MDFKVSPQVPEKYLTLEMLRTFPVELGPAAYFLIRMP